MKKACALLLVSLLLFLSAGCGKNTAGQLTVTATFWSGWEIYEDESAVFAPVTQSYDLIVGGNYTLPDAGMGAISFRITSIREDGITIQTSEELAIAQAGIDMANPLRQFNILYEEPLSLATLTMDAGTYYDFVLSKER